MSAPALDYPASIKACNCLTPFGDAVATCAALVAGQSALKLTPVLGRDGGDAVPLALLDGGLDETLPPRWLAPVRALLRGVPVANWGSARLPVIVTSSNFGVGSLYAYTRDHDARHLAHGPPFAAVELLRRELGWGENVIVFSHACVTAHLGLAHAAHLLAAGLASEVLVCSFDFVSPFVAGGFHALKILNGTLPAPFAQREIGAIGLGDGAAYAVLGPAGDGDFSVAGHVLHNEMFHFTSNRADGTGFVRALESVAARLSGQRVWVKGHGTGTLEAGRLEAEAVARCFPGAPLVSWKGALGHTLGSCGLVELAITIAALRSGRIPGTVGATGPAFTPAVALEPFSSQAFDAAVLTSNAFGGAHAALVLRREPPQTNGPAILRRPTPNPEAAPWVRYLHRVVVERPPETESAAEARERLRLNFPRGATRRMTHLGMLLGVALGEFQPGEEASVIYATRFAETRALEEFLASFPAASPLLFQTSIHPGGIQQVLIGRQKPVARLWPLASGGPLVEQALLIAMLDDTARTLVVGGEERGSWLLEAGMASERAFAFALELTRTPDAALGSLTFQPDSPRPTPAAPPSSPSLESWTDALEQQGPLEWSGIHGRWTLHWH